MKSIYYCNHCRKFIESIDDLYFVDEKGARGFCSEKCIETFYAPIVEVLRKDELQMRIELSLVENHLNRYMDDETVLQDVLHKPDQILEYENKIGEAFFTHVKSFNFEGGESFYAIVLCAHFDNAPSFIFRLTLTESDQLKNYLSMGVAIADSVQDLMKDGKEGFGTMQVNEEFLGMVENKKSRILAQMIKQRSDDDIPIEEFHTYDDHIQSTMEQPDEIYLEVDDDGDKVYKYIKAHSNKGLIFFYFVICTPYQEVGGSDNQDSMEALLPIISFPTTDADFSSFMKTGQLISGPLKS